MTEFNGALDRWLDPPCGDLAYERWCEDVIDEAEGEKCEKCLGPTFADIDQGQIWVKCTAPQPDGGEGCGWMRTETFPGDSGPEED